MIASRAFEGLKVLIRNKFLRGFIGPINSNCIKGAKKCEVVFKQKCPNFSSENTERTAKFPC